MRRAQVYIGRGGAAIENAWIRREWRTAPPETVALLHKDGGLDWCAGAGPDLAVVADGRRLDAAVCEDVTWSEELCSAGAVLETKMTLPGMLLYVRHVAYHEHAAIQRFISVMSLQSDSIELELAEADAFAAESRGVHVRVEGFRLAHASLDLVSSEPGVALTNGREGLVVGAAGGAHYQIFPEDAPRCAISPEWSGVVEPYESAHLGSSYVFVFDGNPEEIVRGPYADFLAQLRKERKMHQKTGQYVYEY